MATSGGKWFVGRKSSWVILELVAAAHRAEVELPLAIVDAGCRAIGSDLHAADWIALRGHLLFFTAAGLVMPSVIVTGVAAAASPAAPESAGAASGSTH
jgi:hypothetical protein